MQTFTDWRIGPSHAYRSSLYSLLVRRAHTPTRSRHTLNPARYTGKYTRNQPNPHRYEHSKCFPLDYPGEKGRNLSNILTSFTSILWPMLRPMCCIPLYTMYELYIIYLLNPIMTMMVQSAILAYIADILQNRSAYEHEQFQQKLPSIWSCFVYT